MNIQRDVKMLAQALAVLAALLMFAGCKDFFHPEGPGEQGFVQYTVTYDANGGNGAAPSAQTADSGAMITLASGSGLTKAGYTFSGWNTSASGAGTSYAAGASFTVTANIRLYAKWVVGTGVQYTVTYDANGGNGAAPSAQTADSGVMITLAGGSGLTKAGYTFSGWNTSASGAGTSYAAGASFTVTANIRLYAKWVVGTGVQYTVTYDANGGNGAAPSTQTANSGVMITLADGSGLTKAGHTFSGWNTSALGAGTSYAAGASFTVTANIRLYAKWNTSTPMPTTSLQAALDWLDLNAMEGGEYTITVNANETIAPKTLSYNGKTVSVTLDGGSTERTIALSSSGSLFTVGSGVTLTLGDNITLQGRSDNTASLAYVNGGTLVMNTGSKISSNGRGGVYVDSGIFTMNSGIISGNSVFGTSYSGGGVYVASGTFAMSGGTISGNSSSSFSLGSSSRGGGVYVGNGTFIMSGGTISGNSSSIADSSTFSYGGGVYVASGTFAMSGGTVSGNTASATSSYGGGVYVSGGTFTMSGGTVSGNTTSASLSSSCGGGVYVASGTFTMSGGTVSGNTTSAASLSSSCGGGVYVASGTFTMSDGTISGNTASVTSSYSFYSSYGGGVYIKDGTFTKQSGGTIYGANASGSLKNAAINGQAVYVDGSPAKIRINTAGSGVTLDSAVSGAAGGWETPQSVQISLQTMSSDPSLSSYDTYLSVNQSGYFYVDTWNTSYASYTWYWNGEVIDGESASEYTMAAHSRTPGVYELSVVVTTDAGERLSARCRVVIKAN